MKSSSLLKGMKGSMLGESNGFDSSSDQVSYCDQSREHDFYLNLITKISESSHH